MNTTDGKLPKIAVVGAGITGLTAAYRASKWAEVTLFEKEYQLGGHTHTVEITEDKQVWAVDMGFIVFNDRNYPRFNSLLQELDVANRVTDMSFGVSCEKTGLEYSGSGFLGLFAQRVNLLKLNHYKLLLEILRFNKNATEDKRNGRVASNLSLENYLKQNKFSKSLQDHYIYPIGSAIWSTNNSNILRMPAIFFITFFVNHGLLSLNDRPTWFTILGGSSTYIKKFLKNFNGKIEKGVKVINVTRRANDVIIQTSSGVEVFDGVVVASHSDQTLKMLNQKELRILKTLEKIPYHINEIILHTDQSQLPKALDARASWNYRIPFIDKQGQAVVTYDMSRLQGIKSRKKLLVTLNNTKNIKSNTILERYTTQHPQFLESSLSAQKEVTLINEDSRLTIAGAWCRWGFHEDGVVSAENAVSALKKKLVQYKPTN